MIKKHFVEKVYNYSDEHVIEEVEYRCPSLIVDDEMKELRFFDQEFTYDGTKLIPGRKDNFTSWIYFGQNIGFEWVNNFVASKEVLREIKELFEKYKMMGYESIAIKKDFDRYKISKDDFIPLETGDINYDELINNILDFMDVGNIYIDGKLEDYAGKIVTCTDASGKYVMNGELVVINGTTSVLNSRKYVAYCVHKLASYPPVEIELSNYGPIHIMTDENGKVLYRNDNVLLQTMFNVDPKEIIKEGLEEKWQQTILNGQSMMQKEIAAIIMTRLAKLDNPSNEEIDKIVDIFKKWQILNQNPGSSSFHEVRCMNRIKEFYKDSEQWLSYLNYQSSKQLVKKD